MTYFSTFYKAARKAALQTKAGRYVTGETIKVRLAEQGIVPERNNDIANAVAQLKREGILVPTGESVKSTTPAARGRKVAIYLRQSTR